ncbi:MAG: hypothetical protein R2752_06770 [Vicinamibacterales bacterium]
MQTPQPFIVTPIREPAPEMTVADVILGAIGLTGVMVLVALLLGGIVALLLVAWHRRRPPESDHLPSVSPFTPGADVPPTSRAR